jgi:prolyl-tRNA synthetase
MRYSRLFISTSRFSSKDIQADSHRILLRAGYIRQLGPGLFGYLPLGQRVLQHLRQLIDDEMKGLGGCEVLLPMVNPVEIWERSGRKISAQRVLASFTDSSGKEMVLAPSYEEAVIELVRASLSSYRDLPLFVYQFQSAYRDQKRIRHGLLSLREYLMKDGYSFHRSFSDLNNFFPRVFSAYQRIFHRCGIDAIPAEAGVGIMGGDKAYEFHCPSPAGESVVICCNNCGYTANREIAVCQKPSYSGSPREMTYIDTPACGSMEKLAQFLDVPRYMLAKTMIFRAPDRLVMAVVRADFQVSLEKLTQVCGERILGLASPAELRDAGMYPGYVSPIGFLPDESLQIIIDDSVANTPNLVFGANMPEKHCLNVNFGRDYEVGKVADIARVRAQNTCLHCGGQLEEQKSIELGNIIRLGTLYSRLMGLEVQEERGKRINPFMGSYGIGMDRLLAAVVERHHDERGIVWPFDLAPFRAYLIFIGKSLRLRELTESLYREIEQWVLYDDRDESISTKMKEAALLGMPYLIIVSLETVRNGIVEIIERKSGKSYFLPMASVTRLLESENEFHQLLEENS